MERQLQDNTKLEVVSQEMMNSQKVQPHVIAGIMFKKCCSKYSEVAFIIELLDTNVKTFQRSSDIYEKNIVQVAVLPE